MIGKLKNPIINCGGRILTITREHIARYLIEVKTAISANRYQIEINENRTANMELFLDYIIDESDVRQILLGLEVTDFSKTVQNRKPGMEHEQLYIFGKDVVLLEKFGEDKKKVSLYIKFNKLDNQYVIVISFHEQRYPMKYYFK